MYQYYCVTLAIRSYSHDFFIVPKNFCLFFFIFKVILVTQDEDTPSTFTLQKCTGRYRQSLMTRYHYAGTYINSITITFVVQSRYLYPIESEELCLVQRQMITNRQPDVCYLVFSFFAYITMADFLPPTKIIILIKKNRFNYFCLNFIGGETVSLRNSYSAQYFSPRTKRCLRG